ncbi:ATP-binding protein [Amycolatopsis cihanbeyliensis]|uniref:NB-ARC domain-containing protein n=1 Tax=Amycolatopsis cihanbeyliensis TaxID=1128664 RepID=A0A542DS08_AMYCI|nr:tetratricopeptide repeat protein [Amycolatopsis cihanbeyliensis]TQJ05879.1 NB-ARC domain-containing protein [Amycolatopsis cihanbeyliensis]
MNATARNAAWFDSAGTVVQAGTVLGGVHLHQDTSRPARVPRQLPLPPRRLVGREREAAELTEVLDRGSAQEEMVLLSVEGIGGVGKSALALYWAHRELDRFPDGQLHADLSGFGPSGEAASPLSVLHGFLGALGVAPAALPVTLDAAAALYRSVLAGKRVLVVLDNAADTDQVTPLLPAGPGCAVLVTSRNRLAGLRLRGASSVRLDVLSRGGARELLTARVGADPVRTDPRAVDMLLDCCAGLPLALALVAARAAAGSELPLSVVADELRDTRERLDAFDAGDGSADLRAVLSWSYRALGQDEAGGFRLLGTAPVADLGLTAAASLLGIPAKLAARQLRALERKNLVHQHMPHRFRMHDLIRLYAAELAETLDPAAEPAAANRRLVDFYLHSAHTADRLLYPHRTPTELPACTAGVTPDRPADEAGALAWFAVEHQQVRAAQRAAAELGWAERAWQLSRALDTYQYLRGRLAENVETSRTGVAAAERIGDAEVLALAHRQLGRALSRVGELDEALPGLDLALSLAARAGDPIGQAHTHHDLARLHSLRGDHERAVRHATGALERYRAAGNAVGEAHALNALGRQHTELGDHDRAWRDCAAALALHEEQGNAGGAAVTLDNLGLIAGRTGRPEEAEQRYSRALELCRRQGNDFFEAEVTEHLGTVRLDRGRRRQGLRTLRRAGELYAAQHRRADAERVGHLLER